MKGLLLKDLYGIKASGKAYLSSVLIFVVLSFALRNVAYMGAMITILMGSLPLNILTGDEACVWARYAMTMPVKRSQLVTVKYLLLCLIVPLAIAAIMAVGAVFHTSLIESVIIALACGAISLFSMSFSLMCCFWLGTEKARILTAVSYMLPMFLVYGVYFLFQRGEIALADVTAEQLAAAAALCLAVAAVFAILFWRISCRIIQNRDL